MGYFQEKIGVDLQRAQLVLAALRGERQRLSLTTVSSHWQAGHIQAAEQLVSGLKAFIGHRLVRPALSINLPVGCVQSGVISSPTRRPDHEQLLAVLQAQGVALTHNSIVVARCLSADSRRQGYSLLRYVAMESTLQALLLAISRQVNTHLLRLDLRCYSLARWWWNVATPLPGRDAELYICGESNSLEVSLFLQRRLLDWQQLQGELDEQLQQYLLRLPMVLGRFPGIRLGRLRSLYAPLNSQLAQFQYPLLTPPDNQQVSFAGALGAAQGLTQ